MADALNVFRGFKVSYPEYSVVTPQSLLSYTIRSLKVSEEETLKASYISSNALSEHLNKAIWECLVKKPEEIKTYDDFLRLTTVRDRDALMYSLYHVTYKDIHEYNITCGQCSKPYGIKINFDKIVTLKFWPKEQDGSIFDKEIPVKLESVEGRAIIKQPTLADEKAIIEANKFAKDEIRNRNLDLSIIHRFEIDDARGTEANPISQKITNRDDISFGYGQLIAADRSRIEKAYETNFSPYGIELKVQTTCPHCGHKEVVDINLVNQFFRAMLG